MSETNDTKSTHNLNQMAWSPTPIQQFYTGASIFITGGTGFLGKILISKLITSCPNFNRIYLLVRRKKGKDMQERLDDIFSKSSQIFDVDHCRHKIVGIAGDCMLPDLGITLEDKIDLVKNVNIVFHMAANVRFDEKLKVASKINVQASKDIMQICSDMKQLKSFVHVSTAYTQCVLNIIEERFYAPPMDPGQLLVVSECLSDTLMESITPILLGKWPNTYSFTKAVAEDVVRQQGRGMPVGMVRPGIVISTFKDPVPGWIDNFNGPTGVIAGAATGVLRSMLADPNMNANLVPADLCVNGIIAAAWDVSNRHKSCSSPLTYEIPVYNICASHKNPITWDDFKTKSNKFGQPYPTIKSMWYLSCRNIPNKLVYWLSILMLHYLPAILIDAYAYAVGKKPRLFNTYTKIHTYIEAIDFFSLRQWDYQLDAINELWTNLSPCDKDLFFFNMAQLDWDKYFQNYFLGIRLYLLKDPLDTLAEARVRWNRLYWLHQLVKTGGCLLLLHFVSRIYCSLF